MFLDNVAGVVTGFSESGDQRALAGGTGANDGDTQ
jgi:hypothetical protein